MPSLNLEPAIISGITQQYPHIDKKTLHESLSAPIKAAETVIVDSLKDFAFQNGNEDISSLRTDILHLRKLMEELHKNFKVEVGEIKHDTSEAVSSYRTLERNMADITAEAEAKIEMKLDDKVSMVATYLLGEYEEEIDRLMAVQVSIWLYLST